MNKNSLRSIGIMGALASLAGIGQRGIASVANVIETALRKTKRKNGRLLGPRYRGCKAGKFDNMTRQRVRALARKKISAQVRTSFQLPRRIYRAIVRARANREWRTFGKVTPPKRIRVAG